MNNPPKDSIIIDLAGEFDVSDDETLTCTTTVNNASGEQRWLGGTKQALTVVGNQLSEARGSEARGARRTTNTAKISSESEFISSESYECSEDDDSSDLCTTFDPLDACPRALLPSSWINGIKAEIREREFNTMSLTSGSYSARPLADKVHLPYDRSHLCRLMKNINSAIDQDDLLGRVLQAHSSNLHSQCPPELWPKSLKAPAILSDTLSNRFPINPRYFGRLHRYAKAIGYSGVLRTVKSRGLSRSGSTRAIFRQRPYPLSFWQRMLEEAELEAGSLDSSEWYKSLGHIKRLNLNANIKHGQKSVSGKSIHQQNANEGCLWCGGDQHNDICAKAVCTLCGELGHEKRQCVTYRANKLYIPEYSEAGLSAKTGFNQLQLDIGLEYSKCFYGGLSSHECNPKWLSDLEDCTWSTHTGVHTIDQEDGEELIEGVQVDIGFLSHIMEFTKFDDEPSGSTTKTRCISCGMMGSQHRQYCSFIEAFHHMIFCGPFTKHPVHRGVTRDEKRTEKKRKNKNRHIMNSQSSSDEETISSADNQVLEVAGNVKQNLKDSRLAHLNYHLQRLSVGRKSGVAGDGMKPGANYVRLTEELSTLLPSGELNSIPAGYMNLIDNYEKRMFRYSIPSHMDAMRDSYECHQGCRVQYGPRRHSSGGHWEPQDTREDKSEMPFCGTLNLSLRIPTIQPQPGHQVQFEWTSQELRRHTMFSSRRRYHLSALSGPLSIPFRGAANSDPRARCGPYGLPAHHHQYAPPHRGPLLNQQHRQGMSAIPPAPPTELHSFHRHPHAMPPTNDSNSSTSSRYIQQRPYNAFPPPPPQSSPYNKW
eukprot:GHVH01002914.1.p1 GENE.GHVH01002914.1~~GHVH01002914.1.p1  ORF type:complete len:820 (-),score=79.38 GHVH01002914.1:4225-6684(-)